MSYESDILRDWYLLFHYGSPEEILEGVGFDVSGLPKGCLEFPVATVEAAGITGSVDRALDLGCAVGRSSLEMTKFSNEVIGIDFSQSFVDVADEVSRGESVSYHRYREMHLSDLLQVRLPDGVQPERVSFEQGDAMNLRDDLGPFDRVLAANRAARPDHHWRVEEERLLDVYAKLTA